MPAYPGAPLSSARSPELYLVVNFEGNGIEKNSLTGAALSDMANIAIVSYGQRVAPDAGMITMRWTADVSVRD
jgi:hypothetical protein